MIRNAVKRRFGTLSLTVVAIVALSFLIATTITPKEWRFPWTIHLLERRAISGDLDAAYELYSHYALVPDNVDKSLHWLRVGAENNSSTMQFMLASVLQRQSSSEAGYWYCRAALDGNAEAMYRYAQILSREDRTRRDADLGSQLYRIAAYRSGHITSTITVVDGILSSSQDDTDKYVQALMWLRHARLSVQPNSLDAQRLQEKESNVILQVKRHNHDPNVIIKIATESQLVAQEMPRFECKKK